MGKNKLARWNEFGSFSNVIQPEIGEVAGKDHPIKGNWNSRIFNNSNPIILELGCGKGEYTVELGRIFPWNNYIGVDIKGARMWRGAKTSNELRMTNVAFLRTRIEFIDSFFIADEVDEIWITFPDPHPGARNSNKRLTSPLFINKYLSFLKENGIIHLKTDNIELHKFTQSVVRKHKLELLVSTDDLYSIGPDYEKMNQEMINSLSHSDKSTSFFDHILSIKTHYEKQFLLKGMKITYLSFMLKKENFINHARIKTEN
ncbi:MAG TPA: tRNA (guanosine(46)-N7)-methyltransferase TrmB [Bacteroidales bacterium]|nr:tRNA (guanosine(46)-N7)-methyltransferase TrmB [Bacteroidales bacterium]